MGGAQAGARTTDQWFKKIASGLETPEINNLLLRWGAGMNWELFQFRCQLN